ncbi:hypothetical protein cypCar_00005643 [Cyprinus carpio]|nr:hypothetical protein cypCar_00005643 [Cyprinus carpio]
MHSVEKIKMSTEMSLPVLQVCLQTEAEELRSELSTCREREKMLTQTLHSERERLTQDIQNLLTQLNSTRERNSQLVSTHNNQRESLLAELQTSREELKRFRESVSLTLSQLETEKAELVSHLEDIKSSYEKEVNAALVSVKSFSIRRWCLQRSLKPQTATVTSLCINLKTSTSSCEHLLIKKHMCMRREHSLLLDVMLVLYRREWFLQDAIPYVRRTLRKCGLRPEDID